MDTNEFTKPGGVVIPGGLGITIGFKNGVGGHNLVLKRDLFLTLLARGSNHSKVRNDLLGVFSFTSSRLSSDQHGLILGVNQHVTVGSFSDSPEMRGNFIPPFAKVELDHSWGIDGEPLVRVDNNTEETRVGVDQLGLVPGFQVVKDRSIIEKGQVGHVIAFLKLGWIDRASLLRLEGLFLFLITKKNFTIDRKTFYERPFKSSYKD